MAYLKKIIENYIPMKEPRSDSIASSVDYIKCKCMGGDLQDSYDRMVRFLLPSGVSVNLDCVDEQDISLNKEYKIGLYTFPDVSKSNIVSKRFFYRMLNEVGKYSRLYSNTEINKINVEKKPVFIVKIIGTVKKLSNGFLLIDSEVPVLIYANVYYAGSKDKIQVGDCIEMEHFNMYCTILG